jgi:hypothetical protein
LAVDALTGDVVFALGALLMAWDFIVELGPLYPGVARRCGYRLRCRMDYPPNDRTLAPAGAVAISVARMPEIGRFRCPIFRAAQILCVDNNRLVSEFEIPLIRRMRCSA